MRENLEKAVEKVILIAVPFVEAEEYILNYFKKTKKPKIIHIHSSNKRYLFDVKLQENMPEEHESFRSVLEKNLIYSLENVLWKTVTRFDVYHSIKRGVSICVQKLTDDIPKYKIISNILT